MNLYYLFMNLRDLFKKEGLEPWTSCEFDFTRDGKLKVSFDYIDWIKFRIWSIRKVKTTICIKSLVLYQKWNMKLNKVKEIEQYIKEQDEAEL
ncbi:immunity protein YezG family protein [Staphylococcus aureus]|uniref:immunity protein YezG family protein n=1 Tax=Staphylococcus aureus TaxID=1280 RepID=UPI0038779716